jgi:FkbH-like protein
MAASLKASALRYGIWLQVDNEPMGHTVAAALDPESTMYKRETDGVLVAYTYHALTPTDKLGNGKNSERVIDEWVRNVTTIRDAVKNTCGATTIVQTIPFAPDALLGSLESRVPGTPNFIIECFNSRIMRGDFDVLDVERLANVIGLAAWHDIAHWHWAKLPFSQSLTAVYSDYVARYIAALRGRSRKCLVLDLDNTLWGGTIGDDGIEGIELGNGTPLGEAFLSIQAMALELRRRGVVLAVCSKNDESNARSAFISHPEMLLKEEHVAIFQVNWTDKASNLEAIARALSLTLDSLVFVDDDPAERSIVRHELPAVAVPELPVGEPALWPLIISVAGYFERAQITAEDIHRADQYSANAKRAEAISQSRNLKSYLTQLEMKLEVTSFTSLQRPRITQLVNKSNQYNLTTRRYTSEQLEAMENNPTRTCFAARLRDKFGHQGIISVVICKHEKDDWHVDTWLMSCRVLGRQVEQAFLNCIAAQAIAAGRKRLVGYYVPTAKNDVVKDHFERLGFTQAGREDDGRTTWLLDLDNFTPFDVPLQVEIGSGERHLS